MRVSHLKETLPTEGWQTAWPTEPNTLWWFYGHRFGKAEDKEPELLLVEIWQIASGISYVASGNFFYKSEGAEGVFLRCIPPIPVTPAE